MKKILFLLIIFNCFSLYAETCNEKIISTFSVAAYHSKTEEVGVAVQSKFFGVGVVVPWAKAGVGAVATQSFANTTFGPRGLKMMEEGMSPEETMNALIETDDNPGMRQVGIVKSDGTGFTYTGKDCMAWAGGIVATTEDGITFAAQGNILASEKVVEAMAEAMHRNTHLDFAARLVSALIAGQEHGGDSRGMQSAALLVEKKGAGYGGYTDVKYDLRVDDSKNPFKELQRLLDLGRPIALTFEAYNLTYDENFEEALRIFLSLVELYPEDASHPYNAACSYALQGNSEESIKMLRKAISIDESIIGWMNSDPDLKSLREMDSFKNLSLIKKNGWFFGNR